MDGWMLARGHVCACSWVIVMATVMDCTSAGDVPRPCEREAPTGSGRQRERQFSRLLYKRDTSCSQRANSTAGGKTGFSRI